MVRNLINNGRFVGDAMRLTVDDIVCCPPPLFHCFGLVMGFLASFCHGSAIVFPSEQFDATMVLEAVVSEGATALLGVPTMFVAILDANEKKKVTINTLRTGLAAGAAVPAALMNKLREKMGVQAMLIAYGMTETSPVTFISSPRRLAGKASNNSRSSHASYWCQGHQQRRKGHHFEARGNWRALHKWLCASERILEE